MERTIGQLRGSELDRCFRDWSSPAVLRMVDQQIDPATGVISEMFRQVEVDVVATPLLSTADAGTSRQHNVLGQEFLLRVDQVPVDAGLTTCRLVSDGREWSISRVTRSADGAFLILEGQVA